MNKKCKKIFIILISITVLISTSNVFALENPERFDPTRTTSSESPGLIRKAGPVLGVIRNVGIIIAVIALSVIGIKYMFCSVAEKAEYKKTILPYVVGCFFLIGVSTILMIIESLNL